jgi:hypothetical protein
MKCIRDRRRRGSTLIEFALILPIGVALLAGGMSLSLACLRTMQAGQLARNVTLLAESGVDFGSADGVKQVIAQGHDLGVEAGRAVVYITKVVREPAGFRVDRKFEVGATSRWASALVRPEEAVELEPGESAWVVEVVAESGSFTPMVPPAIKARSVL